MNQPVDLSALLSKPAEDVKAPVPFNDGIYLCQVENFTSKAVTTKDGDKTIIVFNTKVLQELEVGVPNEPGSMPRNRRVEYWLDAESLWKLKEFLEKLGIEGGGKTLMEMVNEAPQRLFRAMIVQSSYTPKGKTEAQMIDNITDVYPAE